MRISRLAFVLLVLCMVFQVVSCCGADGQEDPPPTVPPVPGGTCLITPDLKNDHPYYTVMADYNLAPERKEAISDALGEWCGATNGTLRYNLVWIDMSNQKESTSLSHTIQVYEKIPGPGLAGWTSWQAGSFSAYMYIVPGAEKNYFRRIMLHELGHAFNLNFDNDIHYHGPYQSVMYPSIGDSSEHLSCPELTSFCNNYHCDMKCTYVQQANESVKPEGDAMCGNSHY